MKNSLKVSEQNITVERVREYLYYDAFTGILTWKKKSAKNTIVGSRAGSLKPLGYRFIRFDNFECLEHRFIWFGMTGEWPSQEYNIDHIDGNKSNNAWSNLRLVTKTENNLNVKARKTNKLDIRGIRLRHDGKAYVARIMVGQKEYHVGSFKTIDEAIKARNEKAKELGLSTYNFNS